MNGVEGELALHPKIKSSLVLLGMPPPIIEPDLSCAVYPTIKFDEATVSFVKSINTVLPNYTLFILVLFAISHHLRHLALQYQL